ncbi:hypothetical protein JB92DRAFT_3135455 [Gautieria morchelliformis]|nr:hypothetical protein JB92DRAFT_3135455 [Gautieria morchelliformis]
MLTLVSLALTDPLADLLKKREEQGLNSLPPTVTGSGRPTASFESIIKAAILGSPESRLSVKEPCTIIPRRYAYYAEMGQHEASLRSILKESELFEAQPPDADRKIRTWTLWLVVGHADCRLQILPSLDIFCRALTRAPEQAPDFTLEDGRRICTRDHRAESEPSRSSFAPGFKPDH